MDNKEKIKVDREKVVLLHSKEKAPQGYLTVYLRDQRLNVSLG